MDEDEDTGLRRPVTVEEAAELAMVTVWTIRRWISAGYLKTYRSGRRVYLLEEAVLKCDRQRQLRAQRWGGAPRNAQ